MTFLFIFALPFVLYGIGYGFFHLGRFLAEQAVTYWHRLRRR